MNKRILLISGSPRKGNIDYLLGELGRLLEGNTELVFLRDRQIGFCRGCLHCHRIPECAMNDEMGSLIEQMVAADVLIIGTPNYFDNVTALLKNFIDRTHPCYKTKRLKGKKVVILAVGGDEARWSEQRIAQAMNGFVSYQGLELVGIFSFQALQRNELKESTETKREIERVVKAITAAA